MPYSSSRSTIYVVIGIGLLILTVSQLRRGDEASNASFVANSSPFEALKDYQPSAPLAQPTAPLAEIVQNQFQSVETPLVSMPMPMPTVSLDDIAAKLPVEFPADSIETGLDAAADFVNTPKAIEMPAPTADIEVPHYDLSFEDSEESLPVLDEETAITEPESESLDLAQLEPPEIKQEVPAMIERVSTDMPAFSNISNNDQKRIINNRLASPTEGSEATTSQNTGWKKNPFLTDAQMDSPEATSIETSSFESPSFETSSADTIGTDVIPPRIEAMIQSEFADTSEELSMVADLDTTLETPAQAILPSVDHKTMQSVVAAEENHEISSPSIKIGITESDAQKAVHNIEYGKSLSRRGAAYAARQEFYSSLRILAQSHDKQVGGTAYTQALRKGIIAIKEAQDFIVTDTEAQIGLSVPNVIETHSTKIISAESAQGMTAIEAAQRYFAFASHQLSRCGGQNVVAAEALYCLGKLHSVQAKSGSDHSKLDLAKSMIYHQAAISADGSNFRSLNELGVLYANSGRFSESKHMLKNSLRIKQLPQAWRNLSVIHQRLGEHQLAQLANREFEVGSTQAPSSVIRWTPVEEFNKNAPLEQHAVSQASALLPDSPDTDSKTSTLKSLGSRILDSIR